MSNLQQYIVSIVKCVALIILIVIGLLALYDQAFGREAVKKVMRKWRIPLKYWQLVVFVVILELILVFLIILL